MPTLKQAPWISLGLLLVTYSILGWLLSAFSNSWWLWASFLLCVLLSAKALSASWTTIRDSLFELFKSDSRTFLVAVTTAFLTVVIITWLHIFVHAMVAVSSGILVRLDLQTVGLSERQVFWVLLGVSLAGLGLGVAAQIVI